MSDAKQAHPETELWSEAFGGPRLFKLDGIDGFGINIGGYVVIKPLAEWHRLGRSTGPYRTGEPEDDDGSTTVLDASGDPMTADEIVAALNAARSENLPHKELMTDIAEWGLNHKKSCRWQPASNFQKGQPCECGRDELQHRLRVAIGRAT